MSEPKVDYAKLREQEMASLAEAKLIRESAPLCVVAKRRERPICLPSGETMDAS